jgi:hypothetical protein
MSPASFTPDQDLHFVLCDFGRSGQAYVETDPTQADASTIVRNLLDGQYNRPVRVLALNVEEGWVRDVSQVIAAKVRDVARRDGQGLTGGTRGFIEAHSDPADQQQVLPPLAVIGRPGARSGVRGWPPTSLSCNSRHSCARLTCFWN